MFLGSYYFRGDQEALVQRAGLPRPVVTASGEVHATKVGEAVRS